MHTVPYMTDFLVRKTRTLYLSLFPFVLFTKLRYITALTSALRMYCKCSKESWRRTEMRHETEISHARQESEWNTHKHTFLSNNTSLIAVHFHDLVQLHSHQQRTVSEFTWTVTQTTLFKWTRVRFAGAHPRSEDSLHIIQTNQTLMSIEPGCAPNVLVWKHPKCTPDHKPRPKSFTLWELDCDDPFFTCVIPGLNCVNAPPSKWLFSDGFIEDTCCWFPVLPFKSSVTRITWPLDGDAGLVFRSAHFAKYFTILSVKFESLCIRPVMSAKADKGDRKREI